MLTLRIFLIFVTLILFCKGEESKCGLSDRGGGLIINGTSVSRGKWPWLVALFRAELNEFFCGATLISKQHIVTAAHCMQAKFVAHKIKPGDIVAYLGRHSLSKPFERGSQIAYPSKILIHPDWNFESPKYDADISLIFLEDEVVFGAFISPICIRDPKASASVTSGALVGWGQSSLEIIGEPTDTPRQVDLKIVSNEECFLEHFQLTFLSSKRTFCAKSDSESGPCKGDSGGGLFFKEGSNWFIRGIVSAAVLKSNGSCDVTKHSVFTNIFDFTDWISEQTGVQASVSLPTVNIITRSMWNAKPPKPDILYLTTPSKRVMISHTVTEECDDQRECVEMMQSLQNFDQSRSENFNDIYCNFFIGGDGLILEGRGWTVRGEHTISSTQSHNDALCVSFIGNFQSRPPKQSNLDAFFKLLEYGVAINVLDPNYVINAQRDFHSSKSPGDAFYNVIRTWPKFRNKV